MNIKIEEMVGSLAVIISLILIALNSGERAVKPRVSTAIFILLPTAIVNTLLFGANCTINDCIRWMCENSTIYMILALALSISGTIGGYIDGAIVLYKYRKRNTEKRLSHDQAIKIIRFGSDREIVRGKGVCDLRWKSTLYNLISNSAGAMCHVAMLIFIKSLPDYISYLEQTNWTDYFSLISSVMVIPSLSQFGSLQKREYPDSVESDMDNPDNFLMNRIHVFLDSISLWFTFSMVLMFGFTFITYSLANIRKYELSVLFIIPIFTLAVFMFYLATSPLAIKHKAINTHELKISKWLITASVIGTLLMYKPSWSYLIIIAFCILIYFKWDYMIRRVKENTKDDSSWEADTSWITKIPIIMILVTAAVVIIVSTKW